jgi:hypothetical protein
LNLKLFTGVAIPISFAQKMKSRINILVAAGLLLSSTFCVSLLADSEADEKAAPDYKFSGAPNAKDAVSTVEAFLYYDKDFASENLSLKIDENSMSITTTWSNNIVPKNLRLKEDQKYRVTLIHDNRLHPIMLTGKYGTSVPTVSRIEALDGKVIYDASICPKHGRQARRLQLPIAKPFSDTTPSAIRLRDFPYGCVSYPTMKVSWAEDTRETVLEFVCDECVRARETFLKSNSEQAGAEQPATRPESKSEGSDKPQPEAEGRSR